MEIIRDLGVHSIIGAVAKMAIAMTDQYHKVKITILRELTDYEIKLLNEEVKILKEEWKREVVIENKFTPTLTIEVE